MLRRLQLLLLPLLLLGAAVRAPAQDEADKRPVIIGSKTFAESRLLAEIMAQLVEAHTDIPVVRKVGLNGTMVCFSALQAGEIDLYPEYTGTGLVTILKADTPVNDPLRVYMVVEREFLERYDLVWGQPFGFNNTYAMAVPHALAQKLGLKKISDLNKHPDLRVGVSHEFLNRPDGWPGLVEAYGLHMDDVRGMEHGLAYEAIHSGQIDVIDAYSTDGKLKRFNLTLLQDDEHFFPPYHAAPLIRHDLLETYPKLLPLLNRLGFLLTDESMQDLNYQVEQEKRPFADVAHEFLANHDLLGAVPAQTEGAPAGDEFRRSEGFFPLLWQRRSETLDLTGQHLFLTLVAVLLAALVSIPLGILITRTPRLAQPVLGGTGVIQTIPSLALLAFMIPIPGLGLGATSAIVALFLYALLPIVRNTYTGIRGVNPDLVEAARGMGLTDGQILVRVQLPLATRTIMAGVRTSTVISVGVATLAAFIGAGGLGEPIITGLQLNEPDLIMTGAIPAAALAVVVDQVLGLVERALVPRGISRKES